MKRFERITISGPEILDYPATQRILTNLKKFDLLPTDTTSPEIVDPAEQAHRLAFEASRRVAPDNHPVALGKRILHLTTQPGVFIKQCPGTNNMLCCHYYVVNFLSNCPYDCTYCYLQTYLNQPMTTVYVNEDDVYEQVRKLCARPPVAQFRVGTGELGDSLALDPITGFSERLARVMGEYKNVRLELKTKSTNVEHLFGLKTKDHVILAWSINPPEVAEREEHGAPTLEERLQAAKLAVGAGFDVAFHFDPMVQVAGWRDLYADTATRLLDNIPHDKIQWISIGGLRYQPQLRPIAVKRHPDTSIFFDESVAGEDGKLRYLRTARVEMFQFLNSLIKAKAPKVYTYLCMESRPVWDRALGRLPDRGF